MYCKNCGRHLKEGTRFCDRCGQSVRKNSQTSGSNKRQEIEELKAERLNRKKRLAEKEAKQAEMRKRKKKRGGALSFVVIAVLIAAVSVIIGYRLMAPKSGGSIAVTATQLPTGAVQTVSPASSPTAEPADVKSGYTSITISGITCPYPSNFHSGTVTGNQKLSVTDALGSATMTVTQEGKSGNVNDLMREYAREIGGEVSYSRAAGDWFAVTTQAQGNVYHRKCILRNDIAVYYDFTYSASSSSAQKYTEYIEYIDANFK